MTLSVAMHTKIGQHHTPLEVTLWRWLRSLEVHIWVAQGDSSIADRNRDRSQVLRCTKRGQRSDVGEEACNFVENDLATLYYSRSELLHE